MNTRRYRPLDFCQMSCNEFRAFTIIFEAKAFRLLGINYKKSISWYWDVPSGDLVFYWE